MNKEINVAKIVNSGEQYRYIIVDMKQKRKTSWKRMICELLFFPLTSGVNKLSECEKLTGIIAEDIYFNESTALYYKEHLEKKLKKKLNIVKLTLKKELL